METQVDVYLSFPADADSWCYGHRFGNGEISEKDRQKAINRAFWKLCDLE